MGDEGWTASHRSEKYVYQCSVWPSTGRHILAQYDAESVVVYQAYRRSIGEWAIRHQKLGGPHFNDSRMSWIKPNFLWMMYRSGWGTKDGQQVTDRKSMCISVQSGHRPAVIFSPSTTRSQSLCTRPTADPSENGPSATRNSAGLISMTPE